MNIPPGTDHASVRKHREELRERRANVRSILISYVGVILVLIVASKLTGFQEPGVEFAMHGAFLTVALIAASAANAVNDSLTRWPDARGWWFGVACAPVMVAIGLVPVFALFRSFGVDVEFSGWELPGSTTVVLIAVLPAVVEEWLCRGVLWTPLRKPTSEKNTIAATALLFGLLHVYSWGPFGFPSRFAAGLVLGWLRAKTRSIAPGMLTHFLNNLFAAGLY